jgi:hypothetical protein
MSVGYFSKPLVSKLGIKEGSRVAILNAPKDYEDKLRPIVNGVTMSRRLDGYFDLIQIFARDKPTLEKRFEASKKCMKPNGSIWISWPKRSSGLQTSVGESEVRKIGLIGGLVDVKICAIDETWSGLKFVVRVKDRR